MIAGDDNVTIWAEKILSYFTDSLISFKLFCYGLDYAESLTLYIYVLHLFDL